MRTATIPPLTLLLLATAATLADNWPQYKGPLRNDISAEKGLAEEWPQGGPKLLWTFANAGEGLSGPAIVDGRLYTLGGRGESEYLIALDVELPKDGSVTELWAAEVGPLFTWEGNRWSSGPSATPTVDGDRIYALGGNGHLVCFELATGKERWRIDLPRDMAAEVNPIGGGPRKLGWGFTWSPLVDGDTLVCVPGGPQGTLAAVSKLTGEVLWRSTELTDQAAYTSAVVANCGGVKQYVVLSNKGVAGIRASDGKLLWNHARGPRGYTTEVINTPIVHEDLVYVTVGAGQGCELIRVKKSEDTFQTESVYDNKNLVNHHGNVILFDGHVYGFSQGSGWTCQNFTTGEVVWNERRQFRGGSMIYADGRFILFGEDRGDVAMIDASTEGWNERGRFQIPQTSQLRKQSGKIWTPPVIANGKLYLRDQELLFCYDLK